MGAGLFQLHPAGRGVGNSPELAGHVGLIAEAEVMRHIHKVGTWVLAQMVDGLFNSQYALVVLGRHAEPELEVAFQLPLAQFGQLAHLPRVEAVADHVECGVQVVRDGARHIQMVTGPLVERCNEVGQFPYAAQFVKQVIQTQRLVVLRVQESRLVVVAP